MDGSSASILGDIQKLSSSESEEGLTEDAFYKPDEAPKRRTVSGRGFAAFISVDILKSQNLASIATRIKINPSKQIT